MYISYPPQRWFYIQELLEKRPPNHDMSVGEGLGEVINPDRLNHGAID